MAKRTHTNKISKQELRDRIKEEKINPKKPDPNTQMGVKKILSSELRIEPHYMMATTAYHLLGDISRDLDLCYISGITEDYYIGSWVTGYGFISVLYPKDTTRLLNDEEIERYNKHYIQISSQPAQKLKVD